MYQCQLHLALIYSGLLLGSAPLIFWFPPNLIPWALLYQSFPCFAVSLSCHWLASVAFSLGQFSPDLKQTSLFLKLPPFFLFKNVFHLSQNFWTHHLLSFSICWISSHLLLPSQHSKPWSSSCQLTLWALSSSACLFLGSIWNYWQHASSWNRLSSWLSGQSFLLVLPLCSLCFFSVPIVTPSPCPSLLTLLLWSVLSALARPHDFLRELIHFVCFLHSSFINIWLSTPNFILIQQIVFENLRCVKIQSHMGHIRRVPSLELCLPSSRPVVWQSFYLLQFGDMCLNHGSSEINFIPLSLF